MTIETTISLDDTVYRAIEDKVGTEGVSRFINEALHGVLDSGGTEAHGEEPTGENTSGDYFETFREGGRAISEMATSTRRRLARLRAGLQRADFPPQI